MNRVLFFDVGYTLVDESAAWKKRCEEQAATEEAQRCGLTAGKIIREIELASAARLPQYRTFIEKYGIREIAPYRNELETLYADAPRVLQYLSRKYKLGVIANQADGLKERLDEFGILSPFSYIVSSFDVQLKKPDARIFEYAICLADCPPSQAVMIGDRLDNDILPAKAVGMKTVWIKRGFGALQQPQSTAEIPDYTIEKLSELIDLF